MLFKMFLQATEAVNNLQSDTGFKNSLLLSFSSVV